MIRRATLDDLNRVIAIYDKIKLNRSRLDDTEYITSIQKKGFLLGLDDRITIEKEITNSFDFLVAEEEKRIVGYLIADHANEQKFYDDEYTTWFNLELKDFYYQNPKGMTLASVVVDPNESGKGIAAQMLRTLEKRLIKESFEMLFSIITVAPITNCATLIWHTKNGFKRLAMSKPRKRLYNVEWYSGILLYKDLIM